MRWFHFHFLSLAAAACFGAFATQVAALDGDADPAVSFSRDVRPILAGRCFACHGPDVQKSGLRFDRRESALAQAASGQRAIVPGNPDASRLIAVVTRGAGADAELSMPPKGEPLTAAEVEVLRRWVAAGAEYETHWSFVPPRRPALPAVSDGAWPRNEIDRFVLARLERMGLSPSPEADRHTLVRRLHLTLTGLPPTPDQVQAFVQDDRTGAYERLVDELLASPRYGEHFARRWLDLARYADTNGYEKDRERTMWLYRDWVIAALNEDMPFDEFTVKQIAGDMLVRKGQGQRAMGQGPRGVGGGGGDARADSDSLGPWPSALGPRIASGFHRNTMINEEGGVDVEEFRFASVVDRVNTTGAVWLGLTVGCAQCHNHKYDPVSQREYYELFAFLNNADEPEIDVPLPDVEAERAAIRARIEALESKLAESFPLPDDVEAGAEGAGDAPLPPLAPTSIPQLPDAVDPTPGLSELLAAEREAGRQRELERQARSEHLDAKTRAWAASVQSSANRWTVVQPTRVESRIDVTFTSLDDGSVLAGGDNPNNNTYEVVLPAAVTPVTGLRLEVLPHDSLPDGGPGRSIFHSGAGAKGDFLLGEVELFAADPAQPGGFAPVKLTDATQSYAMKGRSAALTVDGNLDTGWSIGGRVGEPHHAVYRLAEPIARAGVVLKLRLSQEYIHQMTIGRFRVALTSDAYPQAIDVPAEVEAALATPAERRSEAQRDRLRKHYLRIAPELADLHKRIAKLRASMPQYPTTMVMRERAPQHARTTRIHHRGEFLKPGPAVQPGVPDVLHTLPPDAPRDRLTLARWLVDERNPLVDRVVMNRQWAALFGHGLVRTPEDFGIQGELPTHPDLLDWLATEFVRRGWSLKQMHRLIVTSATFRQASGVSDELLARDPDNRWLARGPRFRVDGEAVRDVALAASGLMYDRIGGPSVFPPQPDGVTALSYGAMSWPTDTGADRYRRGLYTFRKRTAPYAMFATFDGVSGETCVVMRSRSNTPLQALTTLNDVVFVEAARALGRRVIDDVQGADDVIARRIEAMFLRCVGRPATAREVSEVAAFYERQLARLRAGELDAKAIAGDVPGGVDVNEAAAWTLVARVALNLDETMTVE